MTVVIELILYAFLACLLIRAIFSWFEPYPRNQVHRITYDITEPVVGPVRRLVPPMGGFDIAFVIVFFGVSLVLQIVQRAL